MPHPQLRSRLALSLGAVAAMLTSIASIPDRTGDVSVASPAAGRLIILPGIYNTRFHLTAFARLAARQLPGFDLEIRPWWRPLLGLYNLRARESNRAAAEALATEITAWRREHPDDLLYVVGYSGGGGVAAVMLDLLPDDVLVDRLILVAPAVSADYDCAARMLPHVRDYVVNFASEKDLQVGLGTRLFGTIDGVNAESAGFNGFTAGDARLVEWRWEQDDRKLGHRGNHVAYLGRRWQEHVLLPALDPRNDAVALRTAWRAARARAR